MVAAVETMAYTNEVPWHGLGVSRPQGWKTVGALLKDAGIDWKVERKAMFNEQGEQIPKFAALTRDRDNKVLDVVGGRYVPVQNAQAFEFFKEFVEAGKATMETAGSLMDGQIVWGLAKLGTSFEVTKGDKVNGYMLCMCPHKKGKSLLFKMTAVRVVCNNTLAMALSEGGEKWTMGHRTAFDGVKVEEAKAALGIAREQVGEFEKQAKILKKIKLSNDDVVKVLSPIFNKDEAENSRRMKQLIDIYEKAPGQVAGDAWAAFNAVTYYADHVASRSADKRLTNAWLGRTAMQKELVLERLLELA